MPIIIELDVMLARRKMRSKELAERIGITEQNVSLLKSGKVKGVRFETLEKICDVLDCQPGDILIYEPEKLRKIRQKHAARTTKVQPKPYRSRAVEPGLPPFCWQAAFPISCQLPPGSPPSPAVE